MKARWSGIILIVASTLCALETRADDLKGPDGRPFPGTTRGKTIPTKERRLLREPGAALLIKTADAVEEDVKAHPDNGEGEVELRWPPGIPKKTKLQWKQVGEKRWEAIVPGGGKLSVDWPPGTSEKKKFRWKRLGEERWEIVFPGGTKMTVERTAEGTSQYVVPPLPVRQGTKYVYMQAVFKAVVAGCSDAVWVQYEQNNDSLYDRANKVPQSNPQSEVKIDGRVPYEVQLQDPPGTVMMSDQPGLHNPSAASDADVAKKWVENVGNTEAPNKKIAKVERVESFWTYLICTEPYKIIGHYSWGFAVTLEPDNAQPIKVTDRYWPLWIAGK